MGVPVGWVSEASPITIRLKRYPSPRAPMGSASLTHPTGYGVCISMAMRIRSPVRSTISFSLIPVQEFAIVL